MNLRLKSLIAFLLFLSIPPHMIGKTVTLRTRKPLIEQFRYEDCNYIVKRDLDLNGDTLIVPKNCSIKFKKGSLKGGLIVLENTSILGNASFLCKVVGSVNNERIYAKWFDYNNRALDNLFSVADGKTVVFEENSSYKIDYLFTIPSCTVEGNGTIVELLSTPEHANLNKCIKIRNKNYESRGVDSFELNDMTFKTSADHTYLFNLQNTKDCILKNCIFECSSTEAKPSVLHCFDIRGNNIGIRLIECTFKNTSGAKEGGCLWLRSFGAVSDIQIRNSKFQNNCTDELFAINAVTDNVSNVLVDNCTFEYERDNRCQEPHVLWGMTRNENNTIENIKFKGCLLQSDFLPLHILNANVCKSIKVTDCSFDFSGATLNSDGLTSISFTGPINIHNSSFVFEGLRIGGSTKSYVHLFSSAVEVTKSKISNDFSHLYLGCPNLAETEINFDNSTLFVECLPASMIGCKISLGSGTPRLAANPYAQTRNCIWKNNQFESKKEVQFNLTYKSSFIESENNYFEKIEIIGAPIRK